MDERIAMLYAYEGHQGYEELVAALDEHKVVYLHERDDSISRPKLYALGGIHIGADEITAARSAEGPEHEEGVEAEAPAAEDFDADRMAKAVMSEWKTQDEAQALWKRLRAEAEDRWGCELADPQDAGSDMFFQTDAGRLAAQAEAYEADEQVFDNAGEAWTALGAWRAAAVWNALEGDLSVGYHDDEGNWMSDYPAWRIVNETGEPWPAVKAHIAAGKEALRAHIVGLAAATVKACDDLDDTIERWVELGFDADELTAAIEARCYDVGTNIEEFVCERVEVCYDHATENVLYEDGFAKAQQWWRDSGIGKPWAFNSLTEPQYEPIPAPGVGL